MRVSLLSACALLASSVLLLSGVQVDARARPVLRELQLQHNWQQNASELIKTPFAGQTNAQD